MFRRRDNGDSIQARVHALNTRRERPPTPIVGSQVNGAETSIEAARLVLEPAVVAAIDPATASSMPRGELAREIAEIVRDGNDEHQTPAYAARQSLRLRRVLRR